MRKQKLILLAENTKMRKQKLLLSKSKLLLLAENTEMRKQKLLLNKPELLLRKHFSILRHKTGIFIKQLGILIK
ncbi:hypothetical protein [Nostoc sp.]|uniref:hypothetical protein n=1 Tax=Nostoc sp. TaxID=1180 RepID=UPI002FFC9220